MVARDGEIGAASGEAMTGDEMVELCPRLSDPAPPLTRFQRVLWRLAWLIRLLPFPIRRRIVRLM